MCVCLYVHTLTYVYLYMCTVGGSCGVMVKSLVCRFVVQTPVALLCSLSDKYHWKRYEPPYSPTFGLNSTTTFLLEGWIWHQITFKG